MAHDHANHHSPNNIKVAFFLNLGFTFLEIIGGFYVNSISIISDALHDLGDSLSLGLSWYLQNKSKQGANKKFSFGYNRFSLLGALVNSIILIIGSVYVIYNAVSRLIQPEHSNAQGMVVFAIIGLAVNGYAAWKLGKGTSMNEKVVSWHLLEDVLGWAAVLIVAVILLFTDNHYLDPALSLAITVFILWNVIRRLRETLFIFLQGVPSDIDMNAIKEKLLAIKNVASLHHTHVWSLEGEKHVFTTHLKLENISALNELLEVKSSVKQILGEYRFEHYTIETELDKETCGLKD